MSDIQFKIREEEVDGLTNWLWIEKDKGGWDGPKKDWQGSHKAAIEEFVKHRGIVVQAGGNQGLYPALLNQMFSTVYTFEPDWMNFHCLSYNCCDEKIVKFNCGLGSSNRMVSLNRSAHLINTGTHKTVPDKGDGYVPVITIDSLPLKGCDLLWLDVEGNEKDILEGAGETIRKFKPIIMAENSKKHSEWMDKQFRYQYKRNSVSDGIYVPHTY